VQILEVLQEVSKSLLSRTREVSEALDELTFETSATETRLQNVLNRFLLLSHRQFIENVRGVGHGGWEYCVSGDRRVLLVACAESGVCGVALRVTRGVGVGTGGNGVVGWWLVGWGCLGDSGGETRHSTHELEPLAARLERCGHVCVLCTGWVMECGGQPM